MIKEFKNYLTAIQGKSQKTAEEYEFDLNIFYEFLKKRYKTEEINIENIRNVNINDLHAFISHLTKARGNSNKTKARKISCLKSYFKWLKKYKMIEDNPTLDLESPKIEKRLPVYLSLEDSKKLLDASKDNKRDFAILTLFLNTGLRLSELVSIDIDKINKDTLTIIGKGNKERTVYLNNACLSAIEAYRQERDSKEKALFISNRKTRISQKAIEHLLDKYLEIAGLSGKGYSPHKLRHTAATLMYQSGVDIRALQEILGHESIATTQIYTHINQDQLRNAVKLNPLNVGG